MKVSMGYIPRKNIINKSSKGTSSQQFIPILNFKASMFQWPKSQLCNKQRPLFCTVAGSNWQLDMIPLPVMDTLIRIYVGKPSPNIANFTPRIPTIPMMLHSDKMVGLRQAKQGTRDC